MVAPSPGARRAPAGPAQGSIRAPHWRGGGVAHGPKTRNYAQRTPKKMIRLALRSALSDRAAEDKVLVIDDWGFDTPSTKAALSALAALKLEGKVLVVLGDDDVAALKSFRNLPGIQTIRSRELNAYDVLVNDWVVFTEATLPGGEPAPAAGARGRHHGGGGLMKDARQVIIEPIVSEKSYALLEEGVYTFRVHPTASKPEIRDAVETIFGVSVTKVNTLNRKGKRRRNRRTGTFGKRPDTKRALVTLAEGDSIELFGS